MYGTTSTFYVDDYKVAEKLFSIDRQVQLPNGFRLIIRVHPGSPNVDMNPTTKEKIKLVMAKRYTAETKALDLTKFHSDPDLQNYFCALFKPIVFLTIVEIIAENIPELEALNLFDNKISVLSFLKKSMKKISNLKILHMGNNKVVFGYRLSVFLYSKYFYSYEKSLSWIRFKGCRLSIWFWMEIHSATNLRTRRLTLGMILIRAVYVTIGVASDVRVYQKETNLDVYI